MLHLLGSPLSATLLAFAAATPPSGLHLGPLHAAIVEASAPRAAAPTFSVSALSTKPEIYLGETHTVAVQMHGEIVDWQPYLTRFHPDDYRCLSAWADEQWLWIEEEYNAPAAQLFVKRGTPLDAFLSRARPHSRLALDLVVREMHAGRSWIEITGATRTESQVPEGTVLHAIKAMELIEREGWALAVSELERALKPNLPGHVRRELEEILAVCETAKAR